MSSTANDEVVIGIFYDRLHTEQALSALQRAGFHADQIRVTVYDVELETESGSRVSRAPSNRIAGTAGVGAWGVVAGLCVMLAVGCITAVSLALAASLVLGLLAGVAVGIGAGRILRVSLGRGGRREDAPPERSPVRLSRGVVTVRPDGREAEATAILCWHAGCHLDPIPAAGTQR